MKTLTEKIAAALEIIEGINFDEMEEGKHIINDDLFLLIQKYNSKTPDQMRHEAHKRYVDIQYIVEGKECIEIAPVTIMEVDEPYSEEKDVAFFKDTPQAAKAVLTNGGYVVLYPEDSHKPGMCVGEPTLVKKIVGKVRI